MLINAKVFPKSFKDEVKEDNGSFIGGRSQQRKEGQTLP